MLDAVKCDLAVALDYLQDAGAIGTDDGAGREAVEGIGIGAGVVVALDRVEPDHGFGV